MARPAAAAPGTRWLPPPQATIDTSIIQRSSNSRSRGSREEGAIRPVRTALDSVAINSLIRGSPAGTGSVAARIGWLLPGRSQGWLRRRRSPPEQLGESLIELANGDVHGGALGSIGQVPPAEGPKSNGRAKSRDLTLLGMIDQIGHTMALASPPATSLPPELKPALLLLPWDLRLTPWAPPA